MLHTNHMVSISMALGAQFLIGRVVLGLMEDRVHAFCYVEAFSKTFRAWFFKLLESILIIVIDLC